MKRFLPYLSTLFIAALFIQWDSSAIKSVPIHKFGFEADSGFILKPQAEQLLKKIHLDTLDVSYIYSKDTDTIGKYYKTAGGNFYACIEVPYHAAHKIAEVSVDGKIIRSEDFYSGSSFCCWNNSYDGFQKHGKYFTIKSCSTGSAYCSGELDVFEKLTKRTDSSILESEWVGFTGDKYSYDLSSKMQIRNDTIFMKYTIEKGVLKKKWKVKKTKTFDVFYTLKNSKWIASDTTKLIDYRY